MSGEMSAWEFDVRLRLAADPLPIAPRDHQKAAWDAMTKWFFDEGARAGLIVVPTGGGKTMLSAHWLLKHHVAKGGRVLWLAHRRSLLRQAMREFRRLSNVAYESKSYLNLIAISSDDARWSNVSEDHDVVFSSMQTAVLEGNIDFVENFIGDSRAGVFVVVDEAHHAPAPGYSRLLSRLKERGCKLLGLTATPVRADEKDEKRLAHLFDEKVVYQVGRRELVEKGILAAPSFETIKTRVEAEREFTPQDHEYLKRFGDIAPSVLSRLAKNASRNRLIVEQYAKNRARYGPTIVFAADTLHCATLAEEFRKAGIEADYVAYDRKNSNDIISRYQERREPDVLVNVEMLTEGFDAPHTRTVFIARPTRSESLLTQMVGRALRGRQSNGNETAFLVTFLDTWEQFNVLDAEYVLGKGEPGTVDPPPVPPPRTVRIPEELVREAYSLVMSNFKGFFEGVYQCLPHGWFIWEETFEDDQQSRRVMVFESQVQGWNALREAYRDIDRIPDDVTEDFARDVVRRFFSDAPDPLPRWADVKAMLDAIRKGCDIHSYTFEEKRRFDPAELARKVVQDKLDSIAKSHLVKSTWDGMPVCQVVYQDDYDAFLEDVLREERKLISEPSPRRDPEVEKIVPTDPPKPWPMGEPGYSLSAIRESVTATKKHFPAGPPRIGDLRWSSGNRMRYWGFCRYSDRSITINRVLNSPDVPMFVLEFLMYHELLHADMPSAGHNRDFKARERQYQPSVEALRDAESRGVRQGTGTGYWRARADTFLDTFHRYYKQQVPDATGEK